jgi:hypothetical protein
MTSAYWLPVLAAPYILSNADLGTAETEDICRRFSLKVPAKEIYLTRIRLDPSSA